MNEGIILRPLADSDKEQFRAWVHMPHVALWYHDPESWIDEIDKREGVFSWIHHFIAEVDGCLIGFGQYYEYLRSEETWHGSVAVEGAYSIDYLIGESDYIGKGLGCALVQELVALVRSCSNARRIIVQPEPENKASCGTLLSCGFRFDEGNKLYLLEL